MRELLVAVASATLNAPSGPASAPSTTTFVRVELGRGLRVWRAAHPPAPVGGAPVSLALIRVPNTGAANVERAFAEAGVLLGKARVSLHHPPLYEPAMLSGCPLWLRPPSQHVPGSIAVVRNPYDRLVREVWGSLLDKPDGPLGAHALARNATLGCARFRETALYFLSGATKIARLDREKLGTRDANTMLRCHTLPQWWYAQHAEWVVPFGPSAGAAISALAERHGVRIAALAIDEGEPALPPFLADGRCFDRQMHMKLLRWDASTFAFFGHERWPRTWRRARSEPHALSRTTIATRPEDGELEPAVPEERCARSELRGERVLWLFWAQGWAYAPPLVQAVARAWRAHNPRWAIHQLDLTSAGRWVDLRALYSELPRNTSAAYSDVLRTELIYTHGGVWADATVYPTRPLEDAGVPLDSPFWAYQVAPGRMTIISSWFLVSACNGLLLERIVKEMRTTQPWLRKPVQYFWWHYMFERLLDDDPLFAQTWYSSRVAMAGPAHLLHPINKRMCMPADNKTRTLLRNVPLLKLSNHAWIDRRQGSTRRCTSARDGAREDERRETVLDYVLDDHALAYTFAARRVAKLHESPLGLPGGLILRAEVRDRI